MNNNLRMTAITLLVGMAIGCNSKTAPKDTSAAEARLIGHWRGKFVLDNDTLRKGLAAKGKTPDQISKALASARKQGNKFETTWAVLKGRVEVATFMSAIGDMNDYDWEVLEADGDVITIRMKDPNGKRNTDEYKLTFSGPDSFVAEVTTAKQPIPPIKFDRISRPGPPAKSK